MTAGESPSDVSRLEVGLDDTVVAPAAARDAADGWLAAQGVDDEVRHDVLLAISELVTNAITHARSAPTLALTLQPDCLRVEVTDRSAHAPRLRPQADATGGFGLRLVGQVTDRWGWSPIAGGKAVWAEFQLTR